MSFFSRLFGTQPDPKEEVRPLWHAVVREAREPKYYAEMGAADTIEGRFDMITAILAPVILRLEANKDLIRHSALLTELFVEDMDGQLRESGVGDPVISKHMGKLVSAMGGRIGAFRDALAGKRELSDVVDKNVTLSEGTEPALLAAGLRQFSDHLSGLSDDQVLAGDIAA